MKHFLSDFLYYSIGEPFSEFCNDLKEIKEDICTLSVRLRELWESRKG